MVLTSQPAPLPAAAVEPSRCCSQSWNKLPHTALRGTRLQTAGKRVAGCVSNGKQWLSVP